MSTRNKNPRYVDRFGAKSGGGPPIELESDERRGIRGGAFYCSGIIVVSV